VNAYTLVYDRQIAPPAWGRPFVRAGAIVLLLTGLDRVLRTADLLPGSRGIARVSLVNRGDRTGELRLAPSGALRGSYAFALVVRYSDSIQHADDKLEGEEVAAAELAIRFTEHGTVRVDLPVALAVTPALMEPTRYRLEPLDGAAPLQVRTVGREERRMSVATGRIEAVDDPTYLELFVTPAQAGRHRVHLPALATRGGGVYGPVSGEFVARLVKRGFAEKTLGPRAAHAHELAPGVVFSAIFAEDERAGGRGGSRG
jgi:hypothetical protein